MYGPADSGDLATELAGLFVELGGVARDHDSGVFVAIDELHDVALPALEALVMGLHRASQLRLPRGLPEGDHPRRPRAEHSVATAELDDGHHLRPRGTG